MDYNEKQKQILANAEKLFACKGFDGTSVRDIADEAGVNLAMISYYFGSKEKLMQALFEQRTSNIRLRVESLLQDDKTSPFEKIYTLVDEYVNKVMEKQQFFKIMICEQVINKNPVILNLIKELKTRNTEEVNKLIKYGQDKKVFKKDVDVILLINTLFGCVMQTMISMDHYREYNNLQNIPDEKFNEQIKKKLAEHIKVLFKALLSYEA